MRLFQPLTALCGALLATVLLSACSWMVAPGGPAAKPRARPPNGVQQPSAIQQAQPSPAPVRPRRVAVVYAANVPAYASIAKALVDRFGKRARRILVSDDRDPKLKSEVRDYAQVIAVGVKAARAASELTGKELVFCHVFNYRDHGLADSYVRGVSMVPPADKIFAAWKELTPDLKRVGIITGPGHEELISAARKAARRFGLQLIVRVAHSDEATIFEYKRLVPRIDGFWLLPDNRILSHRALRQLMAYSVRHRIQVVAFSPEFLRFGALMSASAIEADVVERAAEALTQAAEIRKQPHFRLLPLTRAHFEVNPDVARRLGHSGTISPVQSGSHAR
jgi:putative ABC transport system substrate-binding protein